MELLRSSPGLDAGKWMRMKANSRSTRKNLLRLIPFVLLFLFSIPSCSSHPPDELFVNDISRMVLIDREMGFTEEITKVEIVERTSYENQMEVQVRISGWAVHPEITIGATLPAARTRKSSWAVWKYFCSEVDKNWVVEEKYKVKEGFY
jgi:hypothetical protein